jgi:hypothetical protein
MARSSQFTHKLTELLVQQKTLSEKEGHDLEQAFAKSDRDQFIDFLEEEGLVEKTNLLRALSVYYQVPYFDVEGHFFDTFLLQKFPKDVLLRLGIIPLEVDENMLIVVAADPNEQQLLPVLGQSVSYDIRCMVGLRKNICDAVKEYYDQSPTQDPENEIVREESDQFDQDFKDVLEKGDLE